MTDDLTSDEMAEMVMLYVLLNQNGWPLSAQQAADFADYCQILLILALVRSGMSTETAIHQVTERDGKLHVAVENGELSVSIAYDEHAENAIAITITEDR